jgi:Domain of unknown function (DUF4397)
VEIVMGIRKSMGTGIPALARTTLTAAAAAAALLAPLHPGRTGVAHAGCDGATAAAAPEIEDGDASDASDAAPAHARVRVAHLSPDAPAVDFCLAPAGTGQFTGPVLAAAGGRGGLAYTKVTRYLDVPAIAYDVRLVAPASRDCARSLGGLPDVTGLPALLAGEAFTLAATGELARGGTPFAVLAYRDDARPKQGKAKLRFIHASPGTPSVDVGVGSGDDFSAVFSDVGYGGFAHRRRGYVTTAPLEAVELSARATGADRDVLSIASASLPAGAIATAFAVGKLGDAKAPLRVLLCDDSGAPRKLETRCALVGGKPRLALRAARW